MPDLSSHVATIKVCAAAQLAVALVATANAFISGHWVMGAMAGACWTMFFYTISLLVRTRRLFKRAPAPASTPEGPSRP